MSQWLFLEQYVMVIRMFVGNTYSSNNHLNSSFNIRKTYKIRNPSCEIGSEFRCRSRKREEVSQTFVILGNVTLRHCPLSGMPYFNDNDKHTPKPIL